MVMGRALTHTRDGGGRHGIGQWRGALWWSSVGPGQGTAAIALRATVRHEEGRSGAGTGWGSSPERPWGLAWGMHGIGEGEKGEQDKGRG